MAQVESVVPERFVPVEMAGQLVETEHLARYRWAAPLAGGRRVLDAGCGTAYGSAILADAGADSVLGVDIAAAVLDAAREQMPPNVTLTIGDLRDLHSVPSGSIDLVVCFEVIEHVAEQSIVLAELRRVLAADGVLVVSSPNRDEYPAGNPHHLKELTPPELEGLLLEHFDAVELYRQEGFVTSAVLDSETFARADGAPVDVRVAAKTAGGDADGETYTLAVTGAGPLPAMGNVAVLGGLVEVRSWVDHFAGQQAMLRDQQQFMTGLDELRTEIEHLRSQLIRAETEAARLPELEAQIAELRAQIEPPEMAVLTPEQRMQRAEQTVDQMSTSISWRLTQPLRALKRHLRG